MTPMVGGIPGIGAIKPFVRVFNVSIWPSISGGTEARNEEKEKTERYQ